VNIGGVANVTFVGRDGDLIAFDTGPGNALIDDWVFRHTGRPCDEDGRIARAGRLPEGDAVTAYLRSSYFEKVPPKSLDRNDFPLSHIEGLSLEDGARVLTQVTAASIARSVGFFAQPPALWVICGGGRRNAFMMESLRGQLAQPMLLAEEAGFDGDAIEAQAFAFLAVRALRGLPISFPGTTGVAGPMTGGVLARP
jgi:anhydro-N-acetylmuramic acid kinase